MAKLINGKRSVTTDLEKLKEKAKSIMSNSDDNTQNLIDMSAPTLNSVADDIENENLSNVTTALNESNINLDPSANTPNRFPNYISSLNPLNRNNGILNNSLSTFSNPSAYDTNTANLSDNIFKPNLVTTPGYSLANRVQTLIDAGANDLEVDPDLTIRYLENNGYGYDTSTFDDTMLGDTTGMTDEQINLLREKKSKEFYEEQNKKNQEVYQRINALTPELLHSFDEDVRDKAEKLDEIENEGRWGMMGDRFSKKGAYSDMHDIQDEIAHRARTEAKSSTSNVFSTDLYRVKGADGKGATVPQDEFDNYLINYMEQLEAYKNGEIDKAPEPMEFYVGAGRGYSWWENSNKSSVFSKVTNDELESMYNVYMEGTKDVKQKEEIFSAVASQLREQMGLQADEKINVDGVVKVYKDKSQIEDEKKDLETEVTNVIVNDLGTDSLFQSLNSVQQQRVFSNVYSNVAGKIADKYSYIQQYDDVLNKIAGNVYTFSSDEERQKTINRLTQLRNETKSIIDTYIRNATEAELIYAKHGGDEVSAQKEMREKMGWGEDEGLDVNVLSNFYMKGIDESNAGPSFGLDVDNRLLNVLRVGIGEMDDIIYDTDNEGFWRHVWHEFEYGAGEFGEALEGAVGSINYLTDITPLDGGMYAAGETQLGVYKTNYELAGDAERFFYNVAGIAPEVASMFVPVGGAASGLLKFAMKIGKVEQLVNKVSRFSNVMRNVEKAVTDGGDVAKAMRGLGNYVKNNQWMNLVGKFVKETVENYWQDAAFFNRWDTQYLTEDQDWWTNFGVLFGLAHMDTLGVLANGTSKVLLGAAQKGVNVLPSGNKIIDGLKEKVNKTIGKGGTVNGSFIDTTKYFSEHPDELASAVLREMGFRGENNGLNQLVEYFNSHPKETRKMLNVIGDRIFEQSREAAKILNKLKESDATGMIAIGEKQYVGSMLSSLLSGTNNVNNRELVNMIENAGYKVPDMLKRYTNSVGTMVTNSGRSSLFTKLDAEKIHLVDYDRKLDLATDNTFSPTKVWEADDIKKTYDNLDRMGVGYKEVFENPKNTTFFKEVGDGKYVLTKEGLDALGYSNNKLIPEVLAQSKETTDFVENLRKINKNNNTEVISESLISEIEQTDAYERLSSALSKYVC